MMKAISILFLFCLFSAPGFSQVIVDPSATDNECPCQITCDLDTGYCYDILGDCDCDWDCNEVSPGMWDCDTNCFCDYGAVDAVASAGAATQHGNQLAYSTTRNNLMQVNGLKLHQLFISVQADHPLLLCFGRFHLGALLSY